MSGVVIEYLLLMVRRHLGMLIGLEFVVAVAVASSCVLAPSGAWCSSQVTSDQAARALLTYASIGLGTCSAAISLGLRIADAHFIRFLRVVRDERGPAVFGHYARVVYTFSWSAVCHWITVLVAAAWLVMGDPSRPVADLIHRGSLRGGAVLGLLTYDVLLFLRAVLTSSVLGFYYVEYAAHFKNR